MRIVSSLPDIMLEPLVRAALLEDLGRAGDLTSDAIVPPGQQAVTHVVSRSTGTIAGMSLVRLAFHLIDPAIKVTIHHDDGAAVTPGTRIATIAGPVRGILSAERTALNFLCRMSGIASATAVLVASIAGTKARIVCTRKTTPGLRAIEKHAVRAGGGSNHRFGLDDAVLIKDNHVAIAGGVRPAVERARASIGHLVKIELEIDGLDQLDEALTLPIDAVLLDNMPPADMAIAVERVAGRIVTEASGRISPQTAPAIAATGVDLISAGWLTHSAPILDIGLDFGSDLSARP
jgi:nicotinate-nucleotide pyrophosphorylase (carboxylating)